MALSLFLAKFFGLWFIFVGVAWLYRKDAVSKLWDDMEKNTAASAVAASINIIIGLLVVLTHEVWMGWPIIITFIGWLSLLKAFLRVFKPAWGSFIMKSLVDGQRAYATGFIVLLVGVFLTYVGFSY